MRWKFFGPGGELPSGLLEEVADSPHLFTGGVTPPRGLLRVQGRNEESDDSSGESEEPDNSGNQTPATHRTTHRPATNLRQPGPLYLKEKGVPTPE